jgi:DNA-directed RNA polymerase subunit beta
MDSEEDHEQPTESIIADNEESLSEGQKDPVTKE